MKVYHYCGDCKAEGLKSIDGITRTTAIGTDGFGQPVTFIECECGGILDGYLGLNFYENKDFEIDSYFLEYLKTRITFYYEGYKENEDKIRERLHRKPSLSRRQIEVMRRVIERIDKEPTLTKELLAQREKLVALLEEENQNV